MKHPLLLSAYLLSLAILLSTVAACEREHSVVESETAVALRTEIRTEQAGSVLVQARFFQSTGEHEACAASFAAAAKIADSGERSSRRWYEAARCAARAGDFQQSIFHLQAAASRGFAGVLTVKQDPLFRPLHGGSRWQLVIDIINENDKALSPG